LIVSFLNYENEVMLPALQANWCTEVSCGWWYNFSHSQPCFANTWFVGEAGRLYSGLRFGVGQ